MKNVVRMAKAFNVEVPVLNMVFVGYFTLLVVTAGFIMKHADSGNGTSNVTATTETQVDNHQN